MNLYLLVFLIVVGIQCVLCVDPAPATTTTTKTATKIHKSVSDYITRATTKIDKRPVLEQKEKAEELKQGILKDYMYSILFFDILL